MTNTTLTHWLTKAGNPKGPFKTVDKKRSERISAGMKPYYGTLRVRSESARQIFPGLRPRLQRSTPSVTMFGDESTAPGLVIYGLVVVKGGYEDATEQAFRTTLAKFGCTDFHGSHIFSGHRRLKETSQWKHLREDETWDLCLMLADALIKQPTSFCLGLVHKDTYPAEMPNGDYPPIVLSDSHLYAIGYRAAMACFETEDYFHRLTTARGFIDPAYDNEARMWGHGDINIERFIQSASPRLKPQIVRKPKPLLLSAADLLAYCAGRAYTKTPSRSQGVCIEVMNKLKPLTADAWWNPTEETPDLINDLMGPTHSAPASGVVRAWHNPDSVIIASYR